MRDEPGLSLNLKNIEIQNMRKYLQFLFFAMFLVSQVSLIAGNPDRQGEAGAGELLFNPWARSAGLHSMTTSFVSGVEAMRINVAGIGRMENRELLLGNTQLYSGSTLQLNSFGYAQKSGERGAFAVSLATVDFGEIDITTENQPEGTGGNYSPSFFNLGLGYAYTYENKISVGVLLRVISESLSNLSAFGACLDAGVQYVSGEKDNFKLGISLRNIGTPMRFSGEGLNRSVSSPGNDNPDFNLEFAVKAAAFELPSLLNIGASYDIYVLENSYVRGLVNFTSNAFSRDNIGAGFEFNFNKLFELRAGYRYELDSINSGTENIYTGVSAGASVYLPLNKTKSTMLGLDYSYRTTNPFAGTHNFGLRLLF